MDTPVEEQQHFQHVTCNIAAAEHEVFTPGALSLSVIDHVSILLSTLITSVQLSVILTCTL